MNCSKAGGWIRSVADNNYRERDREGGGGGEGGRGREQNYDIPTIYSTYYTLYMLLVVLINNV